MRERTRQDLLARGEGITAKGAAELAQTAHYKSWSGCLSGCDWSGERVYLNGKLVSGGTHYQNDAPTGWETRGLRTSTSLDVDVHAGDRITVVERFAKGRNGYGEPMRQTEKRLLTVV